MDIKLDISPEMIEKEITNAIIKSSIGKHIEQSVHKAVGGYSFDNQVTEAVKNAVADMIRMELAGNEELKTLIHESISKKLTNELVHDLMLKLINKINDIY